MMDMDMMSGGMGAMMGALFIFWALFGLMLLALAVAALVWLIRALRRPSHRPQRTATEELDRRYATGELTREQYLQTKADLTHA